MDGLRQNLERQGLENITYMVVNHQGEQSQRLHPLLHQRLTNNITLYQQRPGQADVWEALAGDKDDFLIYDRCGRLTYHISLPYSILGTPYVENAIKDTYCKRVCGDCRYESVDIPAECNRTVEAKPEDSETPDTRHPHQHPHHHGVGHGHGHHGHGHHGQGHHGHMGERRGHGHHGDRREGHGQAHAASRFEDEEKQHHQQQPVHMGQEHAGQHLHQSEAELVMQRP